MSEHVDVLIVEDSPDDTELMARALRRSGFDPSVHRVDTAPALAAALAARSWHVILADYRMPAFSGHEALAMVQEAGVDIPFILVSGAVGEETAVAMMKAGVHDFVLKHNLGRLGAAVGRELREAEVRRRRRWADTALEMLAEAARLSAEGLDVEAIVQRAAAIPVPRLADWCIVYARQWTALGHIRAVAATPAVDRDALGELADGYPPRRDDHDPWLGVAQRTRSPVLLGTVDDAELARITRDARHAQLLRRLAAHSLMVIPEIVGERVAGVLVLGARTPGRYGAADLAIASDVGGRVALILENARLTREREEFISTAVHEIKTPIAVIKTAVQLVQQLPTEEICRRVPDLIARLTRQASRIDRLVTEVLEVSRLVEACYDAEREAYMQEPGSSYHDASTVQLITLGYLDPRSARAARHLASLERALMAGGGLLHRYTHADDIGAPASAFLVCSFWYVEALAAMGRLEEALKELEILRGYANHLGLFSEDVDPATGSQWGNFPQAYSHVGLINAVLRISSKIDYPEFF